MSIFWNRIERSEGTQPELLHWEPFDEIREYNVIFGSIRSTEDIIRILEEVEFTLDRNQDYILTIPPRVLDQVLREASVRGILEEFDRAFFEKAGRA